MSRLIWSSPALQDVARLHAFLEQKSEEAAQRAVGAIRKGIKILGKQAKLGRPVEEMTFEFREWIIEFGQSAYIVLYHFDGKEVVILAVRHG
jgi:plasmid stabilization system protein ParE